MFLDLFRMVSKSNPEIDQINSFIEGFSSQFSTLTTEQLIHFCGSLANAEIVQEDILQAVFDNVKEDDECDFRKVHF